MGSQIDRDEDGQKAAESTTLTIGGLRLTTRLQTGAPGAG